MRQATPCRLSFGAFYYGNPDLASQAHGGGLKSCHQLVRALHHHSAAKVVLFLNGILLETIERYCTATALALRKLVKEQRVEMLGASFYDAQLAMLPTFSRQTHIERMTSQLSRIVRKRPQGCWLEGGIWDPVLPLLLDKAAIRFVFLPSQQLKRADAPRLYSPLITEEQGKTTTILPLHSDQLLASPAGFVSPREFMARLQRLQRKIVGRHEGSSPLISCFIDGQNPRYDYHWYLSFFDLLAQKGWALQLPSPYLKEQASRQKSQPLFSPSASVVADFQPVSLRNGQANYRQLFNQHPTSRLLLNRVHYSQLLASQLKGDRQRRKEAHHLLWCGRPHRICLPSFLADPDGRQGCYRHLIRCEKLCRQYIKSPLTAMDYNNDGVDEYIFRGRQQNAVVQQRGGALLEWEDLIEERSYASLFYESSPAAVGSFLDSITLLRPAGLLTNSSPHVLAGEDYRLDPPRAHSPQLRFTHQAVLPEREEDLVLQKEYSFNDSSIHVAYQLTRTNYQDNSQLFLNTDLHLALPVSTLFSTSDRHGQLFSSKISNRIDMASIDCLLLSSPQSGSQLTLRFSHNLRTISQPLYTLKNNRVYFQGIKLRCSWLVEADWMHQGRLSISVDTTHRPRRHHKDEEHACRSFSPLAQQ